MTTPADRTLAPGVVVLSCTYGEDVAHLRSLETAEDDGSVLCLVPLDVEPDAGVQALWHRLARRRFVTVLRHTPLHDPNVPATRSREVADVLAAVSTVARWTAAQSGTGLRLMALVTEPVPSATDASGMHGVAIRGNVEVVTTTEGVSMTIAPDDPFAVPEPGTDPDIEPSADPVVEPLEPQDPDDVPEVPQPPAPAPDETGIR
jgi:hypothetical protein